MYKSIKITDFKRISEDQPIILDNLEKVNYLVWENWSWKSSILESIPILEKNFRASQNELNAINNYYWSNKIITPKTSVRIDVYVNNHKVIEGKEIQSIQLDKKNKRIFERDTRVKMKAVYRWISYSFSTSNLFSYRQNRPNYPFKKFNFDLEQLWWTNDEEVLSLLVDFCWVDAKNLTISASSTKYWLQISDKSYKNTSLKSFADGYISFLDLYFWIKNLIQPSTSIIMIDEPEFSLYPWFQKKVPDLLNKLSEEFENVTFIVATHSPFIISSSSKFDSQKLYLIKEWQTSDIFWNLWNLESQNWYQSWASLLTANNMLWIWLEDYFPNKIIFCENSLMVVIKWMLNKFNIPSPTFFYTNWDSSTISNVKLFKDLLWATQSINWIVFWNSVIWIVDKLNISDKKGVYRKIEDRIRILKKWWVEAEELEELYPRELVNEFLWNIELYQELLKDWIEQIPERDKWRFKKHAITYLKESHNHISHKEWVLWILKEKLAYFIVEKTSTLKDFKSWFDLSILD